MKKVTVYFKDDCPLYREIRETTAHFNKEPEMRKRLKIENVDDGWTMKLLLGGWDRFRGEFKDAKEVIMQILADSFEGAGGYFYREQIADRIINEASAFGCVGKEPEEKDDDRTGDLHCAAST